MDNDELKFYGEHEIAPFQQDINNIEMHYLRRQKLYRQCGIPLRAFRGAEILEVGPGRGDNTLAFFEWMNAREGEGHVDLVEANPQSVKDMQKFFETRRIDRALYTIHQCTIEEFVSRKKFDIAVAEGFLPIVENQEEIIQKLISLICSHGIIVITCADDVGMFIEAMKRLVGVIVTADVKEFEDKVNKLVDLFEPQLKHLRGMSRSPREWVIDQMLNYAGINGRSLSMGEAIRLFGEGFYILGASPMMFTDYTWYKDIWSGPDYGEQFEQKRLSLLLAGMPEVILDSETICSLVGDFKTAKSLAAQYEKAPKRSTLVQLQSLLQAMEESLKGLNQNFTEVFHEIQEVLSDLLQGEVDMAKYPHFFQAFGRSMQYMAFEKK